MAGYGIRSFLIAQSLNQIDKAYGQNHSILDNCHVRVTFATNDERTAKRISETLGTATELRAQRNYAGHRLRRGWAPDGVARNRPPLLTPGEVMQLPPDEAVVMVSSVAPIKAKKLRYYADANFKRRVLPPPALADGSTRMRHRRGPTTGAAWRFPPCQRRRREHAATAQAPPTTAARRQPELSEAVAYGPNRARRPTSALLDDDDDLPLPRQLDPAMQRSPAGFPRPQRRNRAMSQYRLNLFIQPEHAKRLDELAAKKGVSSRPSSRRRSRRGCRPMRRPARGGHRQAAGSPVAPGRAHGARPEHPDRNAGAVHPLLPDRQYAGSRAHRRRGPRQGKARFEQFVEQLGRHLLRGRSLVRDVVEELHPTRCGWMTRRRWPKRRSVPHERRSPDPARARPPRLAGSPHPDAAHGNGAVIAAARRPGRGGNHAQPRPHAGWIGCRRAARRWAWSCPRPMANASSAWSPPTSARCIAASRC
jgi:hypothetical protein